MAEKRDAPQPRKAQLTAEAMRAGITTLQRRIAELEQFDPRKVNARTDPSIRTFDARIQDAIAGVFDVDTYEFLRFRPASIDQASAYEGNGIAVHELRHGLSIGKERALANLRNIVDLFSEKLTDAVESPESRARRAFGDLDLHPEIARAAGKLFSDGHYANAVEDACKVLDMLVQMRAMRTDVSGTALMRLVFSTKAPILRFNNQENESGKSEQEGMMHLFEGAMLALRNPRAHGLIEDHPERAVEYLSFLSMLAKSLDRAERA